MNSLRRKLLFVGGLAAIPLSMGCITASVMSGGSNYDNYSEKVSSVLLSADGKTLAVIGKEFHYLFDAPEPLKAVLQPELRGIVDASFNSFKVEGNQRIAGTYFLRIGKNASAEQKEKALAAGFKASPSGELHFNGSLSGTRYAANGIEATAASQKLNKEYTITVMVEKSAGSKAASTTGKILLTPITLAADGVLIIAAVPLLLILMIGSAASSRN